MLEVKYDVVLTTKEKVFLLIGTLPLHMGCDMACMDFLDVKEMVTYLRSSDGQVFHAHMGSCSKAICSSYDGDASSSSDDEDSCSSCANDADDAFSVECTHPSMC